MVKTQLRTREAWPQWAVSRIECASCGGTELSDRSAPHYSEPSFVQWVRGTWAYGNAMMTRMGFKIWCSSKCGAAWKRANKRFLENINSDGHAHKLKIWQEEKAWKQGLIN